MTNPYFSKTQFGPIEKPLQELMELNMRTLQNFAYFNPGEIMNVMRPEEFLDKNIGMLLQNGHKTLDYFQSIFDIMEKNWFHMADRFTENTRHAFSHAHSVVTPAVKQAVKNTQDIIKTATPSGKKSSSGKSSSPKSTSGHSTLKASGIKKSASSSKKRLLHAAKPSTSSKVSKSASSGKPGKSVSSLKGGSPLKSLKSGKLGQTAASASSKTKKPSRTAAKSANAASIVRSASKSKAKKLTKPATQTAKSASSVKKSPVIKSKPVSSSSRVSAPTSGLAKKSHSSSRPKQKGASGIKPLVRPTGNRVSL